MQPYKLAVIVPFSDEFKRDMNALYDEIIGRIPKVLAETFDATVLGKVTKPGANFDNFASCTAQSISSDAYAGLVAADGDVAENGGILNGFALAPQAKSVLLSATDDNGRPLFINNVAEGAIPQILGAKTLINRGLFKAGSAASGDDPAVPNIVGIAGDWTKAMYGTVEGVLASYSNQATLDLGSGNTLNLFQQNMFALRVEIEIVFIADTSVFNLLTTAYA